MKNQHNIKANDQMQTSEIITNTQAAEAPLADPGGAPVAPHLVQDEPATNSQATSVQDGWKHIASLLADEESPVSLKEWVELERQRGGQDKKASLVRKLSVAYGIGKLLESSRVDQERCSIDNFAIQELFEEFRWVVVGIKMLTPRLQATLQSTLYLRDFEEMVNDESMKGRDLKAAVLDDGSTPAKLAGEQGDYDEMQLCCALGRLLHFLFSGDNVKNRRQSQDEDRSTNASEDDVGIDAIVVQPAKKQTRELTFSEISIHSGSSAGTDGLGQLEGTKYRPLVEYGCPPSISQLVGDLLSCGDNIFRPDSAFKSLRDATDNIHLLLEEPDLLFERIVESHQGKHLLEPSNDSRLFGRAAEITKIMGVYHRVATGKCEHVFVEGLSG
jgi:hypothetical protein